MNPRYYIDRHFIQARAEYRWVVVDWVDGEALEGLSFSDAQDALDYARSLNKNYIGNKKCGETFESTTVLNPSSGMSLAVQFGNKGTVRVEFDHPVHKPVIKQ